MHHHHRHRRAIVFALCLLLAIGKLASACDTSQFNNFDLTWYAGPASKGNEAYARNGLEDFKNAFKIVIKNQSITTLCANAVSDTDRLYAFALRDDAVEEIWPGAFANVPQLKEVAIVNTRLAFVQDGVFANLNVTTLDLSNNRIAEIDAAAFDNMTELRTIDLQNNRLKVLDDNWFAGCRKLHSLTFEGNEIAAVPMRAFKHLVGRHKLNDVYELETSVALSGNRIKFVHPKAFDGLDGLGRLYLDRNSIRALDARTFAGLKYFKVLDLSGNRLECLPAEMENVLAAELTYLEDNPWDCECLASIKRFAIAKRRNVQMHHAAIDCQLARIKATIDEIGEIGERRGSGGGAKKS